MLFACRKSNMHDLMNCLRQKISDDKIIFVFFFFSHNLTLTIIMYCVTIWSLDAESSCCSLHHTSLFTSGIQLLLNFASLSIAIRASSLRASRALFI